ncbi:hypothetical protein ABE41_002545 [Fictibacillus arsenicus]|uniref:Uncharacterized protein n=1 Tax=Fictibacillus arsenicus TaxID=255247 RepID=A0A1B1Z0G8_9BACL|nr:hypothetical protein ABE41_002545 [Fictibacillus arsenicus]
MRAYYLSTLLVRHATRKLASIGFLADAGAHNFLKSETPNGAERQGGSPHAPGKRASVTEINYFQERQSLRKQPY